VRRDITASLFGRWLAMPMRDRVITGLFTLGGIAFVLNILMSAMESADDGFGVLLIFGVIVFFILSARSRKSRNTP
jgi:ABC-type phosphate/phosphonate transport system permease subunit